MNPTISMFSNALAAEPKHCPLLTVLAAIREGRYADTITNLRQLRATNPDEYNAQKRLLPAFTVSGTCKNRKEPLIHSGLIQGDLDKLDSNLDRVRSILHSDAHVAFVFVSPSGDGLKFGIRVDPSDHLNAFRSAQHYFRQTYQLEIDPSVKDRNRLCFVSFDPTMHLNTNAVPVPMLPAEEKKPAFTPSVVGSRQQLTEQVVGRVEWQTNYYGFCQCPGAHLHTTGNNPKDCEIHLDKVPTIHCFHHTCENLVAGANHQLRSLIAKAEYIPPPQRPEPSPSRNGDAHYEPSDNDGYIPSEEPDPEPTHNNWIEFLEDAADTLNAVIPDPVEIVAGLITEQSKVVIGGGSKTYKTWLSINLALACATAKTFMGRQCLKQTVLYVNLELKPKTFKRRVQLLCENMGVKPDPGTFKELHLRGKIAGLPPMIIVDRIIAAAQSFHATLVVLDPVYKVNTVGDENSSRDQTVLFNQLDRLTTEANCTLVINDHFSKGNQSEKDPLDAIRGSSAKGGDVDAAIVLRAHDELNSYRVDVVHRELPPVLPFVVTWQFPLFSVDDHLSPEDMKKANSTKKKYYDPLYLLRFIKARDSKNTVSYSEWAKLAKIHRSTLMGYTEDMRLRGWIFTVGEGDSGRQSITPKGVLALSKTTSDPVSTDGIQS